MSSTSKLLSRDEVALHNKDGDLWVIVDDVVFDLSTWQEEHPGGKKSLFTGLSCFRILHFPLPVRPINSNNSTN